MVGVVGWIVGVADGEHDCPCLRVAGWWAWLDMEVLGWIVGVVAPSWIMGVAGW